MTLLAQLLIINIIVKQTAVWGLGGRDRAGGVEGLSEKEKKKKLMDTDSSKVITRGKGGRGR